ncbi:hypothetical protein EQW76_00585 [Rhizobium sp. rho-13.1]|uniref:hypothetical protein n=1 Tax=Rhizobium sp. rho-13.1 TaxID=2506431 RepID=UPI00115F4E4C|nr:hypothetical protein [Rhizobium sp. rho-13.1]TQX91272.1 hypothetical protein EQW76_00585 [Rhizobium sp. rho-13.1]
MSKQFTIEDDFAAILKGDEDLPNAAETDPLRFLNNLASGGHSLVPHWGWAKVSGRKAWAQFFLTPAGMGGRLDGGGYAVVYGGNGAKVLSFAICKHEKVDGPTANHSRGWHPGSCKHCGLDMTVDSGD